MAAKDILGKAGEKLAAEHLLAEGFQIVERNWRCPRGEIDIIATKGDVLVFVEVKTRSSLRFGHPLEAITAQKLARLRQLAATWCREHPGHSPRIRIDAIGIVAWTRQPIEIDHVPDVF
jgi:putative endonuclease